VNLVPGESGTFTSLTTTILPGVGRERWRLEWGGGAGGRRGEGREREEREKEEMGGKGRGRGGEGGEGRGCKELIYAHSPC